MLVQICRAIASRTLLEFDYDGRHRIVAPYCHGTLKKEVEALRAIQVGGTSRSSRFGIGKLWHVDKMTNVRNTREPFIATDPDYQPDDGVMIEIHCRV